MAFKRCFNTVSNFVTHKQLKYSSGNIGGHCCRNLVKVTTN